MIHGIGALHGSQWADLRVIVTTSPTTYSHLHTASEEEVVGFNYEHLQSRTTREKETEIKGVYFLKKIFVVLRGRGKYFVKGKQ